MATVIVVKANTGCHLNGITEIPLKLRKPTVAVKRTINRVVIPPYTTSGRPKNLIRAIV